MAKQSGSRQTKRPEDATETRAKSPTPKQIPIALAESGPAVFANHLVVQSNPHEITFLFCQLLVPPISGDEEQVKSKFESLNSIIAAPVAKVVVAAGRATEFLELIERQLSRHDEHRKSPENGEEGEVDS